MNKQVFLIALTAAFVAAGCSVNVDQDALTQKANELKQQAQETLNQLQQDSQLTQKLMDAAHVGQTEVNSFLSDLMQDPTTQQAIDQLGYDVVIGIIQQQVMENNGVIEGSVLNMIRQELENRMGQ
ncbi:hypothetical protein EV586_101835 [Tumebacillus sp. BK434]|uniref:hypothetical protein n=1 Tax=Tumebacillus sp. BK434 TaxID=2512169 RepID=UPI00104DE9B8|nr:hypothetical protein [Tumebacillus sp. BK434]TCP59606.1 hypothetical protein EV586_101835 [Tumebacillus sp. BK434]